jgi:hypothetical protein
MKIRCDEARDIAETLSLVNSFAIDIAHQTNVTVMSLDLAVQVNGRDNEVLGNLVWDNEEEEFVFLS